MSVDESVETGSVSGSHFKHSGSGGVERRISWGMILVALFPVGLVVLAVWIDSLS